PLEQGMKRWQVPASPPPLAPSIVLRLEAAGRRRYPRTRRRSRPRRNRRQYFRIRWDRRQRHRRLLDLHHLRYPWATLPSPHFVPRSPPSARQNFPTTLPARLRSTAENSSELRGHVGEGVGGGWLRRVRPTVTARFRARDAQGCRSCPCRCRVWAY